MINKKLIECITLLTLYFPFLIFILFFYALNKMRIYEWVCVMYVDL